ncbi:MAG TPA: tetratricopeptide repeat protein [Thermoanaerobaculia bacterium]|nr:tetratricopeptide repeat protein [Thermoanaerobaculia bacterium]
MNGEDFTFANLDSPREAGLDLWRRSTSTQSWGLCESLIARSQACRWQDPEQMILLADRAVSVAEGLDPMEYGREQVADLRARTLAELANAYRVADDLDTAERMLRRAVEWSARGTQDPLLLARLMRLTAGLRSAQRLFPEALSLLDAVYTIYERHGDRSSAGRALISKGLYTGYANDPEGAIRLLSAGLAMINPATDPKLVLSAVHNLVSFLVDCGRFEEAHSILQRARQGYFAEGDRLALLKMGWLEGRIAAGLGETEQAEEALVEAQASFAKMGLGYHAALVSMDIAGIWLPEGKTLEVRRLVEEMVATFRSRRVAREALAALLLLKNALEAETGSVALLRTVRNYLRRLEARPAI